jgi:hypothetical protein
MPEWRTQLPQSFVEKQFYNSLIQVFFGWMSAVKSLGLSFD